MTGKAYRAIDVRAKSAPGWPQAIPAMTAPEAVRAAKRLWRWATGTSFEGSVTIISGNRRAFRLGWGGNLRAIYVNPSQGWREFVHDASHWIDYYMNGSTEHGKHHGRFEARMIREVLKRGYLDGALKDKEKPIRAITDPRIARLAAVNKQLAAWATKHRRAKTAIQKRTVEKRRLEKALAHTA